VPAAERALLGIDAGGTSVRARAVVGDTVVHDGVGGPGNPLAVAPDALARSYGDALDGCPDPARVVACAAGAGRGDGRERVERLLSERFPGAAVSVLPDYVAAFMAAPGSEVVVIAGTGSIVCSRTSDGAFEVSGGLGWIVSDQGSAARLGRALLERHCATGALPPADAAAIERVVGTADPRRVAAAVHAADSTPALLASVAPLLTAAVERGEDWAHAALDAEMGGLAALTAAHVRRCCSTTPEAVRVGLVGGVWSAAAASAAFARALARLGVPTGHLTAHDVAPVDGALRLARELEAAAR
jgi:glucosamine kinase